MKRIGGVLAVVGLIAAGALWWQFTRNPWANLTEPQGFAFGTTSIVDAQTGTPVAQDTLDDLSRQLMSQVSDALADVAATGYGLYDPASGDFTVALDGRSTTTKADLTGARVAFETEGTGSGPLFAEFDPNALAVTLFAPADGFLSGIAIQVPMSPTDVTDRIALQNELAAENAARLEEWRASVAAQDWSAPNDTALPDDFYEMTLPGSELTLALPLWAHPGLDILNFGDIDFPAPEDVSPWITIRPWPKDVAQQGFDTERARLMDAPKDELVVISDTGDELILARYGRPVVLLAVKQTDHLGYTVYATAETPEQMAELRVTANSFAAVPPRAPTIFDDPNFDPLDWYAKSFAELRQKYQGFDTPSALIATLFEPENYMSSTPGKIDFTLILSRVADDWPEHSIRITCRLDQDVPVNLADWHDQAGNALLKPTFDYAAELAASRFHIQSGAFDAAQPWPDMEQFFEADMAPIRWVSQGESRAIGLNGHHFFGYQTRLLGDHTLICGMGATHPAALLIALQDVADIELPSVQAPDADLRSQFQAYQLVRTLLPGTYEVKRDLEQGATVIGSDGQELVGPGFEWFWSHPESGVFTARKTGTNAEALFAADGRQLLPPEYEDFQEKEPGLMFVRPPDGSEWLLYSVEQETFVPSE